MPRIGVLIIILVLLAGGAYLLSTQASEVPTTVIETDVPQGGNAN